MSHNKVVFSVLTLLVLVALATPLLLPENAPDLQSTIQQFKDIDAKYNTNWKQETLGSNLIGYSFVDDALVDVEKVKSEIEKNKDKLQEKTGLSTWEEVLTKLADAREQMLLSQKAYHQYKLLGPEGELEFEYVLGSPVVTEKLNCDDMEALDNGARYLKESFGFAHQFNILMDFVLQNAPEARTAELVGINDEKPQFYESELGKMSTQIKINNWGVDTCKRKVYKLGVNS